LHLSTAEVPGETRHGRSSGCPQLAFPQGEQRVGDGAAFARGYSIRIDIPIIFITGYGDVPMTVRAMKAGAVEFLTKPFDDDVLLSAIRHAVERSYTALDQEAEIRALRDCYAALTRREREVMALVVAGLLYKRVGGELGISEITVTATEAK
jgi:FixJ family two-component response regulator